MSGKSDSTAAVAIDARGLAKRFGRKDALRGLDLRVERGRVTVLLGRNGAGKSTLLRLAIGALRPDAGSIRVLGRELPREAGAVRARAGFVPDVPDVPSWMTPDEWLRFQEPHYERFDRGRAASILDRFGVPLDARFAGLSRGQAMIAAIACAAAPDPELLLLDEPFAGLDPVARDEVLRALIGEMHAGGATLLVATHDLDVAARIAEDIAVIDRGRLAFAGRIDEFERESERGLEVALRDLIAKPAGVTP